MRPYIRPADGAVLGGYVTPEFATSRNPNRQVTETKRRPYMRLAYVSSDSDTGWVTTRCYSAAGVEIWNADHGANVNALAVDADGNVYTTAHASHPFQEAGFEYQLIRKYDPDGNLLWSTPCVIDGDTYFGLGIAVNSSGQVYISRWTGLMAKIAKYDSDGSFLGELNDTIFFPPPFDDNSHYYRLAIDSLDDLVATGGGFNAAGSSEGVYKWVGDLAAHQYQYFGPGQGTWTGLTIDSANKIAIGKSATSNPGPSIYDFIGPDIGRPTVTGFDHYARLGPRIAFDAIGSLSAVSTSTVLAIHASTPEGPAVVALTNAGEVNEMTPPTEDVLVPSNDLGSGLHYNNGRFCVGWNHESGDGSHHVYEYPDTFLWSADHGGGIADCRVLPDGKVIVAGERVRV